MSEINEYLIIESNSKGIMEITLLNTLEDLRDDCLYFIHQAKAAEQKDQFLSKKRYIRATYLLLFSYFESAIDIPLKGLDCNSRLEHMSVYEKFDRLNTETEVKKRKVKAPNLKEIKAIRNKIVHFKCNRDLELFKKLNLEDAINHVEALIGWLEAVTKALDKERLFLSTKKTKEDIKKSMELESSCILKEESSDDFSER